MFVRLLKHHAGHAPGRILNAPDGAGNVLLRRGAAEPVDLPTEAHDAPHRGTSPQDAESAPGRRRADKRRR